jgi:hypothetical protein
MRWGPCAALLVGFALPLTAASAAAAVNDSPAPVLAAPGTAQQNWDNLSCLRPGDRLEVLTVRGRVLTGRFSGYSEAAIRFVSAGEDVVIEREHVAQVARRPAGRGARNALLSVSAAALVGLAAGVGAEAACDPAAASEAASDVALRTGRAVHHALPELVVIYRAPVRPRQP